MTLKGQTTYYGCCVYNDNCIMRWRRCLKICAILYFVACIMLNNYIKIEIVQLKTIGTRWQNTATEMHIF